MQYFLKHMIYKQKVKSLQKKFNLLIYNGRPVKEGKKEVLKSFC